MLARLINSMFLWKNVNNAPNKHIVYQTVTRLPPSSILLANCIFRVNDYKMLTLFYSLENIKLSKLLKIPFLRTQEVMTTEGRKEEICILDTANGSRNDIREMLDVL